MQYSLLGRADSRPPAPKIISLSGLRAASSALRRSGDDHISTSGSRAPAEPCASSELCVAAYSLPARDVRTYGNATDSMQSTGALNTKQPTPASFIAADHAHVTNAEHATTRNHATRHN
jgi:hypothetical protein